MVNAKILVIEDNDSIREDIGMILTMEAYDVCTVSSGEEAINVYDDYQPDLVLCDIMMPGLSGFDVLENIRSRKHDHPHPFIFITASNLRNDQRYAMKLGADDFITKPFSVDELLEAIRARLDRYTTLRAMWTGESRFALFLHDPWLQELEKIRKKVSAGMSVWLVICAIDRYAKLCATLGSQSLEKIEADILDRISSLNCVSMGRYPLAEGRFLIPVSGSEMDVRACAEAIHRLSFAGNALGGSACFVSLKFGAAVLSENEDVQLCLQHALYALSVAMENRTFYFQSYCQEDEERERSVIQMEGHIAAALEHHQFRLKFMPRLDLHLGKVVSAEALVRMQLPAQGEVSPAGFLTVAQNAGLGESLEYWVIRNALQSLVDWKRQGFACGISINISAHRLRNESFPEQLGSVLQELNVPVRDLELEVTENEYIAPGDPALQVLNRLAAMGCTLSLDDFGTGYSSFAYIRRLPFHVIKIDQSLTADLDHAAGRNLLRSVLTMARDLGLRTVVEGVETENQWQCVRALGCDEVQGYYISPPLHLEEYMQRVLRDGK